MRSWVDMLSDRKRKRMLDCNDRHQCCKPDTLHCSTSLFRTALTLRPIFQSLITNKNPLSDPNDGKFAASYGSTTKIRYSTEEMSVKRSPRKLESLVVMVFLSITVVATFREQSSQCYRNLDSPSSWILYLVYPERILHTLHGTDIEVKVSAATITRQ